MLTALRFRLPLLATAAMLCAGAGETGPASIEARASGAFGAFLAGRSAALGSDFATAAKDLDQARRDDPGVPELNDQAFIAALLSGQPDVARLAEAVPDNFLAQLVLADRDAAAGNWSAAQARFAALQPDTGVTQVIRPVLVAWAELGAGNFDAALATLSPLVESTRYRGLYALHAALIADQAGRVPIADRFYGIAATDFGPTNLRTTLILASWQARSGRLDEAGRTIDALANADGEFAMSRQALQAEVSRPVVTTPTDGLAEIYLAMAATLRQQAGSGEAMVRLALSLRPGLTAARVLLADIEGATKRPADALAVLAPVTDSDPLAPMVQLRRAALLAQSERAPAAVGLLEKLAAEHPDRPEPWAQLGDLYRQENRFGPAVTAYDRAIDRVGVPSRANWPLFYARGIALEREKRWPKAEADLRFALQLAPDQPSVLNYLAYSWAERGEHLDDANAMLRRAMAARKDEGAYIDSFGWTLLRQGDTAGAIRELERAAELEPEDATINGHLGDALAAGGRLREAEFQWRRALNLSPPPDEAAALEAKLAKLPAEPALQPAPKPTPEPAKSN